MGNLFTVYFYIDRESMATRLLIMHLMATLARSLRWNSWPLLARKTKLGGDGRTGYEETAEEWPVNPLVEWLQFGGFISYVTGVIICYNPMVKIGVTRYAYLCYGVVWDQYIFFSFVSTMGITSDQCNEMTLLSWVVTQPTQPLVDGSDGHCPKYFGSQIVDDCCRGGTA